MNDPVPAFPGELHPERFDASIEWVELQRYYNRAVGACLARLQRCIERLQAADLRPSRQDAFLLEINQQTQRLNTLLRHVLVAGELDARGQPGAPQGLAEQLAYLIGEFRASNPGHLLVLEGPGQLTASRQAWPCLDLTLQLLLANALRCTPAGGTIVITAANEADGAVAHLAVRDGGPGLSPEALARVLDDPGQAAPNLYGLAISLARFLVETMGGRFWVESRPGAGTTFHCGLPTQRLTRRWTVPRPKVLVIDADPALCAQLKSTYEEAGFDVQLAAPGEAGLVEAAAYRPQLVLLGLPDRPLEGLSGLLGLRERLSAAVICLAPVDDKGAIAEALWQGASDCVVKPFNVRELLARTHAILRRLPMANEPCFSMALPGFGLPHAPRVSPMLQ